MKLVSLSFVINWINFIQLDKITSRMFTLHNYVNDVTKSANVALLLHAMSGHRSLLLVFFFANFLRSAYQNIFSSYFSVANWVYNQFKRNQHTGSIKFDVKWLENKLCLCRDI